MTKTNKPVEIAPTVLGRKRAEYANLAKLDGITDKVIKDRMQQDAKLFGVTLKQYTEQLDALNKKSTSGKREQDKRTRDQLVTDTQDLLGVVNLAGMTSRGEVTLTTKEKVKAFDLLGKQGVILGDHLATSFDNVGAISMLWTPNADNPFHQFSVYIGGWEDGAKNLRYQYAPRKLPISKRSGYRDDSFSIPIADVTTKPKAPKVETEPAVEPAAAEVTEVEPPAPAVEPVA